MSIDTLSATIVSYAEEFERSVSRLAVEMGVAAQSVREFTDTNQFIRIARDAGIDPTPENYERWLAVKRRLTPKAKRVIDVTRIRASVHIPKDTVYLIGGEVHVHPSQVSAIQNLTWRSTSSGS